VPRITPPAPTNCYICEQTDQTYLYRLDCHQGNEMHQRCLAEITQHNEGRNWHSYCPVCEESIPHMDVIDLVQARQENINHPDVNYGVTDHESEARAVTLATHIHAVIHRDDTVTEAPSSSSNGDGSESSGSDTDGSGSDTDGSGSDSEGHGAGGEP
jgi:hypothetical protein